MQSRQTNQPRFQAGSFFTRSPKVSEVYALITTFCSGENSYETWMLSVLESGVNDLNVQDKLLNQTTSGSTSVSRPISSPTTPCLMYEPAKTPPKYGTLTRDSPCSIQEDFTNAHRKPGKRCER